MKLVSSMTLAVALTFTAASSAQAADKNPIFGTAKVTTLSKVDNTKVAGKGAYADYYGYYGNLYSSYANYYGNYAYNTSAANSVSEYTNYYYAYYYANQAQSNYYNAYIYSYYGY
jgi:hypothetical protein